MVLEGVVTNVTNFGAFVDIGVHQDGLVHISALSDKFVSDPREVVKAGDVVKVKVMEVDLQRKRIGMSMRLTDEPGADNKHARQERSNNRDNRSDNRRSDNRHQPKKDNAPSGNAMGGAFAAAFANAKKGDRSEK